MTPISVLWCLFKQTITTQNVMCAYSCDIKFTFVYAGWEGSANDYCVFKEAIRKPSLKFTHPPLGIYHGTFLYVEHPHIFFCYLISSAFYVY